MAGDFAQGLTELCCGSALGPAGPRSARVVIRPAPVAQPESGIDELLDVAQTAEILGKAAESTIWTSVLTGDIPAGKIGGTWCARRWALMPTKSVTKLSQRERASAVVSWRRVDRIWRQQASAGG